MFSKRIHVFTALSVRLGAMPTSPQGWKLEVTLSATEQFKHKNDIYDAFGASVDCARHYVQFDAEVVLHSALLMMNTVLDHMFPDTHHITLPYSVIGGVLKEHAAVSKVHDCFSPYFRAYAKSVAAYNFFSIWLEEIQPALNEIRNLGCEIPEHVELMLAYTERFAATPIFKKRARLLITSSLYQNESCQSPSVLESMLNFIIGDERKYYFETTSSGNVFDKPSSWWTGLLGDLNGIIQEVKYYRERLKLHDIYADRTPAEFFMLSDLSMTIDRVLLELHHARFLLELEIPFGRMPRLYAEKHHIKLVLTATYLQASPMVGKYEHHLHAALGGMLEWLDEWVHPLHLNAYVF